MAKPNDDPADNFNPSSKVRQHYGNPSTRTWRRWLKDGVIPKPDLHIRGRDFWSDKTIQENDRRHAADAAKRVTADHFTPRSERALAE